MSRITSCRSMCSFAAIYWRLLQKLEENAPQNISMANQDFDHSQSKGQRIKHDTASTDVQKYGHTYTDPKELNFRTILFTVFDGSKKGFLLFFTVKKFNNFKYGFCTYGTRQKECNKCAMALINAAYRALCLSLCVRRT